MQMFGDVGRVCLGLARVIQSHYPKSRVTIKTQWGCGQRWGLSRQVNSHMECCNSFISQFDAKHTYSTVSLQKQAHGWLIAKVSNGNLTIVPQLQCTAFWVFFFYIGHREKWKIERNKFTASSIINQVQLINRNEDKLEMEGAKKKAVRS